MPTQPDRPRGGRLKKRLEGQRFGMLTVVRYGGQHRTEGGRWVTVWLCRCDCGNPELVPIRATKLMEGWTRSCGCMRAKMVAMWGLPEAQGGRVRWTKFRHDQRAAEMPVWAEFRGLLWRVMARRGIPVKLLRARWARGKKAFEEVMSRVAGRPPNEAEAEHLALVLALRGVEREEFLREAQRAREAVAAHRAVELERVRAERRVAVGGG